MALRGRRQRFGAIYLGNVIETSDVPGQATLVCNAVMGAGGFVQSPNQVPGAAVLVAGAAVASAGALTPNIAPLTLVAGALVAVTGNQIHAAQAALVAGAIVVARAAGGLPASFDPNTSGADIVPIAIRGGGA